MKITSFTKEQFIAMLAEYGVTEAAHPKSFAICLEAYESDRWHGDVTLDMWRKVMVSKGLKRAT